MLQKLIVLSTLGVFLLGCGPAADPGPPPTIEGIPTETYLDILQAEDTRQWTVKLESLLTDPKGAAEIRERVALAAGRIGDAAAVRSLAKLLHESDSVASMAAFALGEIESTDAAAPLMDFLRASKPDAEAVRAASVEALGKIAAALPEKEAQERKRIGDSILETLKAASLQRMGSSQPRFLLVPLAITATLRAKPEGAPAILAAFLDSPTSEVRADALNALARLQAKESLERVRVLLTTDRDPLVRANAARVLGAASDKTAADALAAVVTTDADQRTRVAAIRAIAALAQKPSAPALLERGEKLLASRPLPKNELLEIATALGRVLPNSIDERALTLLLSLREANVQGPEVEASLARIAPQRYVADPFVRRLDGDARRINAVAQGLAAIAALDPASSATPVVRTNALAAIQILVEAPDTPDTAMYEALMAFSAFKPKNLFAIVAPKLQASDVVVRATAADLLAELPSSPEITRALADALPATVTDKQNDAALSIVGALTKAKTGEATAALQEAAKSVDYLVRQRAIAALKDRPGVTPPAIGPVKSRNTRADYLRAALRIEKGWTATLKTSKGEIVLRLDANDAPLTVDSFIQLASMHYFNGLTFHRVVPNFVIQGGDPRGDGSGGPGYAIRCEINPSRYGAGAVGMALSGKDTGGSQFFVTHSPQPHLDGGYTVFGQLERGQDVVDQIERGDLIEAVTIQERPREVH